MAEEIYQPLTREEELLITTAYMQHPDRSIKGVSEQDFATVIRWGNNLRAMIDLYTETLNLIFIGGLTLDVKDGVVFLASPKDSEEKLSPILAATAAAFIPNTDIDSSLIERMD